MEIAETVEYIVMVSLEVGLTLQVDHLMDHVLILMVDQVLQDRKGIQQDLHVHQDRKGQHVHQDRPLDQVLDLQDRAVDLALDRQGQVLDHLLHLEGVVSQDQVGLEGGHLEVVEDEGRNLKNYKLHIL